MEGGWSHDGASLFQEPQSFLHIPNENSKHYGTKLQCPGSVEASEIDILGDGSTEGFLNQKKNPLLC